MGKGDKAEEAEVGAGGPADALLATIGCPLHGLGGKAHRSGVGAGDQQMRCWRCSVAHFMGKGDENTSDLM